MLWCKHQEEAGGWDNTGQLWFEGNLYGNPGDKLVAASKTVCTRILQYSAIPFKDQSDTPLELRRQILHVIGEVISCVSGIAFPLTQAPETYAYNATSCVEWCIQVRVPEAIADSDLYGPKSRRRSKSNLNSFRRGDKQGTSSKSSEGKPRSKYCGDKHVEHQAFRSLSHTSFKYTSQMHSRALQSTPYELRRGTIAVRDDLG